MKKFTIGLAGSVLAGALALPAFSQEPVTPTPADPPPRVDRTTRVDNRVDDDTGFDFNPGWLGLLGLIGLAGLMPRDRREKHFTHTHPSGTTTVNR